jgi:nucleoside-diphosphate-sugar epimerase
MKKALVTGAGGFIGGHLCVYLKNKGYHVTGIDIKEPDFRSKDDGWLDAFALLDARSPGLWHYMSDVDEVYALAADMGGMGYISTHDAAILTHNLHIDLNTIRLARESANVSRYFYASSACVYPVFAQAEQHASLPEHLAYPAQPQDAYGWEKLIGEKLAEVYLKDYKLPTRVARFHNVYGEKGTYKGGREKAPAALCRKIAEAKLTGSNTIEVWGDGEQTRSFMYIDDCVEGIFRITQHDEMIIMNLGSEDTITINNLAYLIASIAGIEDLQIQHVSGAVGVRGRNSDNTLIKSVLGWSPSVPLVEGLKKTYAWIEKQVERDLRIRA